MIGGMIAGCAGSTSHIAGKGSPPLVRLRSAYARMEATILLSAAKVPLPLQMESI